jgi:hypothetical protein
MSTTAAEAQPPAPTPIEKWEISVHFGGTLSTNPSGGTFTPPPVDGSLALATGGLGRRISSWFLGDGAHLLNEVNAQLGLGQRVTPLDDVLGSSMLETPNTWAVGFRVARVITQRLTAEVTFDYSPTGTRVKDSVAGGFADTRTSFANAMHPLLDAGPSSNPAPVTTSSGATVGTGGELLTIGALRFQLTPVRRLTPFVVGGAGVASRFGELPIAGVKGTYTTSFGFPDCVCRLNESDDVRVRMSASSQTVVGMIGVGVDFQPTVSFWRGRAENRSRWGIRLDARVYLSGTESQTFIDTRPSFVTGPPHEDVPDYPSHGVFDLGTFPSAQFSNNPPVTGLQSSLSGQPLTNFRVFEGSGVRTRVSIATGMFLRF